MPKDPKDLGLSEADLADLTDEEREGLLDENLEDEGESEQADDPADVAEAAANEGKKTDGAAADAEDEGDQQQDQQGDRTAGAADQSGADDQQQDQQQDDGQGDGQDDAPITPKADRDFGKEIETLEQQQDALAKKFDEGDLTAAEYNQQLRDVGKKLRAVERDQTKFEMRAEDAQSTYTQKTVPNWLKEHKEYRVGGPRYNALDIEVRRLQDEAIEKGEDPFAKSILEKAHQAVAADFGPAPKPAGGPGKDKTADAGKKTKPREIPPNLSAVPASDSTDDVDGGRFAYLDRLAEQNPQAYEKAIERLSDADRDAYLAL